MRRRLAVAGALAIVVAATLLLASLSPTPPQRTTAAFEPPPVEFSDGPDARPGAWQGGAPMALHVLASSDLAVGALSPQAVLSVTVPENVVQVLVNMTFLTGATQGFGFSGLSTCQNRYEFPIVGDGVTYAVDCGGAIPGAHEVRFDHAAGEVRVHVEVLAWVCVPGARCPDIPPRQ
jgi:hypothetical protein